MLKTENFSNDMNSILYPQYGRDFACYYKDLGVRIIIIV